ncbi:MAG TPA: 3-hydroxyisobutyrate dehydrogenase [Alphaproteobacteria bacterium]|nr:3-hydroxyisobutyrate dehydrogenase [Alphaproteobacteria bacterium]
MARIGFIGLGNMGGPMAANLVKAGHSVAAFDLSAERVAAAVSAGAEAAPNARAALSGSEIVITMLPSGREAEAVYLGPAGLVAQAGAGALLVDCSTIDVATARRLNGEAAGRGLVLLDAPVSGGVAGAAAASLTFMVGGPAEGFARAEPILKAMGKAVIHAGDAGAGQAAKICNNMILGVSMIAVCEAFVLAERLGLAAEKLFEISSKSSGQCWSLTSYCPAPGPVPSAPSNRGYRPGFTAAMMLKDLRLAQEAAIAGGAATPLGAEAAALYGLFVGAGNAQTDFSAIIRMIRGKRG